VKIIHLQGGYNTTCVAKFNNGKTPYNSGVEFGERAFGSRLARHRYIRSDLYPHGINCTGKMISAS